jgi:hypothetical protein
VWEDRYGDEPTLAESRYLRSRNRVLGSPLDRELDYAVCGTHGANSCFVLN